MLEFISSHRLKLPIEDPYGDTNYHEYVIKYDELKVVDVSSFKLKINTKELLDSLKNSLNCQHESNIIKDNTEFMTEFISNAITSVKTHHNKDTNEST